MSLPATQTIAAWIEESLVDREWVALRAIALTVTGERLERSDDGIADYIDEHLEFIAENLRDDLAECAVDGRLEEFEIDSDKSPYIRGGGDNGIGFPMHEDESFGPLSECPLKQ